MWFLFTKLGQTALFFCTGFLRLAIVKLLQEQEVLSIEGVNHFLSVLVALRLSIDVLDDLTCVVMHDKLANLRVDLTPEVLLLFRKRSIEECFLSQMMRVFGRHELNDMLLNVVDDMNLLVS